MAKKTVEDVNGVSGIGKADVIKRKESSDQRHSKKVAEEIDRHEDTEEELPAAEVNITEAIVVDVNSEEKAEQVEISEQVESVVDPVQAAVDEEFMQLAIDAAITG